MFQWSTRIDPVKIRSTEILPILFYQWSKTVVLMSIHSLINKENELPDLLQNNQTYAMKAASH